MCIYSTYKHQPHITLNILIITQLACNLQIYNYLVLNFYCIGRNEIWITFWFFFWKNVDVIRKEAKNKKWARRNGRKLVVFISWIDCVAWQPCTITALPSVATTMAKRDIRVVHYHLMKKPIIFIRYNQKNAISIS